MDSCIIAAVHPSLPPVSRKMSRIRQSKCYKTLGVHRFACRVECMFLFMYVSIHFQSALGS